MKEFTVTRRKLLENGKWIGSALLAGFVGGMPWRLIDSIDQRQTTPKRVRMVGRLSVAGGGSASLTVTKRAGPTVHQPA